MRAYFRSFKHVFCVWLGVYGCADRRVVVSVAKAHEGVSVHGRRGRHLGLREFYDGRVENIVPPSVFSEPLLSAQVHLQNTAVDVGSLVRPSPIAHQHKIFAKSAPKSVEGAHLHVRWYP